VKMPKGVFQSNSHLYDQPTVYQRFSERDIDWAIYFVDFSAVHHPMAEFLKL